MCRGVPVVFSNTSTSNYDPKYYWLFGDGFYDDTSASPDHAYTEAGLYGVLLTVTDNIGCVDTMSRAIEVISVDVFNSFHDTDVCLRTPMKINLQSETKRWSNMPVTYVWSQSPAGSNLSRYDIRNPDFTGIGDYTLHVTASTPLFLGNPDHCEASEDLIVRSHPPLVFTDLTASPTTIELGKSIQLSAQGAVYYKWSPDNGSLDNPNINNPIATPTDSVTYYVLQGMNLWGCNDTAYITIYTDQDVTQFVPSAFTPDGDGKNDVFRIMKLRFQKLVDFRVYNRWGETVFQTITPDAGWDGTYKGQKQDMGTYVYEIIVALPSGENKVYKGNVTLIR